MNRAWAMVRQTYRENRLIHFVSAKVSASGKLGMLVANARSGKIREFENAPRNSLVGRCCDTEIQ